MKVIFNIFDDIINDTYYKELYIFETGFNSEVLFNRLININISTIIFKNMFSQRIWGNLSY